MLWPLFAPPPPELSLIILKQVTSNYFLIIVKAQTRP